MKPGARTLPAASIVLAAGPAALPTVTIRPSRTPTDPLAAGPPVPSTIRALVIKRSNGRPGCCAAASSDTPARNARKSCGGRTGGLYACERLEHLSQSPRGILRVVRDDDIGAGAFDRRQTLQHRAPLVQPAVSGGRLQHRVLAADLVGRGRIAERLFD